MANWYEPTEEMKDQYREWVQGRPERVRAAVDRHGIVPWKLYRIGSGHRVYVTSIEEPKDPHAPVTVMVMVSGDYNVVAMERRVFGINPATLVECDLPGPDEPVGSADMTVEQVKAFMKAEEVAWRARS